MKFYPLVLILAATSASAGPNEIQSLVEHACEGISDSAASFTCKKAGADFLKKNPIPCAPAQVDIYKIGLTQTLCTSISSKVSGWATARVECYQASNLFPKFSTLNNKFETITLDWVQARCGANRFQKAMNLISHPTPDQLSACYESALAKKKADAQFHLNTLLASAPIDAQLNSESSELTCNKNTDREASSVPAKVIKDSPVSGHAALKSETASDSAAGARNEKQ